MENPVSSKTFLSEIKKTSGKGKKWNVFNDAVS